ncbi:MAG: 4Fe-4S binding protein [Bryobacterales bacterium]|nr:4Fe-4S binding protein [Bryobacterales bacterium]
MVVKKGWIRRRTPDPTPRLRHLVQAAFLALNVWIGAQFYFFVRHFEAGTARVDRPAGVEGWLPIAGMMNASYWLQTGEVPRIHPAAMVLFLAFLAISLIFRKAFCGWLCPIGALSEQLWKAGRDVFRRSFFPPRWLDIPLRSLKYVLLGLFVWAVATMQADSIRAFLMSPYGLVADVKMLDFFRRMSQTAAIVIGVLVIGSVFVPNFWCRYLCPYGALMGLASLASPLRIRRDAAVCIDCATCAKVCPSNLPVDQLVQIRSAECLGCLDCVAVCPSEGALFLGPTRTRAIRPQALAAGIVLVFVAAVGVAKWTGHWESPIPDGVYRRLIPQAGELGHP